MYEFNWNSSPFLKFWWGFTEILNRVYGIMRPHFELQIRIGCGNADFYRKLITNIL